MIGSSFVLVDPPHPAGLDDYETGARELEAALASVPGARAVYAYGGIRVPGISDVDRLVVVDPSASAPSVWAGLSEPTRRLAMHTPALVDTETFRCHRLFAHVSSLRCVSGEPIEIDERELPDTADRLIGTEGLLVMALKTAKTAVTGRVKVRSFLCEFGNLALDLRLVGLEPGDVPRAWVLADAIDTLRREWWDTPPQARETRMREALRALPAALADVFAVLDDLAPGDLPVDEVRLADGWRNARLVAAPPAGVRRSALSYVSARSRRLGEARWRAATRTVPVGSGALRILAGPANGADAAFRADRHAVVTRYADFLARSQGYSSIGLALAFRHVSAPPQSALQPC